MKDRGLSPSEVTYTAVISSLTQWQLALSLLKEMQEAQVGVEKGDESLFCEAIPNDITYSCVVNVCAKAPRLKTSSKESLEALYWPYALNLLYDSCDAVSHDEETLSSRVWLTLRHQAVLKKPCASEDGAQSRRLHWGRLCLRSSAMSASKHVSRRRRLSGKRPLESCATCGREASSRICQVSRQKEGQELIRGLCMTHEALCKSGQLDLSLSLSSRLEGIYTYLYNSI